MRFVDWRGLPGFAEFTATDLPVVVKVEVSKCLRAAVGIGWDGGDRPSTHKGSFADGSFACPRDLVDEPSSNDSSRSYADGFPVHARTAIVTMVWLRARVAPILVSAS